MPYSHNPISGEVKLVTRLEARRLAGYGWKATTVAHWREYQSALLQNALRKHVAKARPRLGLRLN